MNCPNLVVETSPAGVESVTIRVVRGERERGLALLEAVLPALRELNRQAKGSEVRQEVAANFRWQPEE